MTGKGAHIAHLSTASAMVLFFLTGAPATAADGLAEDAGGSKIAEIVVTAQKRAESSMDVPATISVLDSQAIEERQIETLTDLKTSVPSLVVGSLFGTTQVSLRGISTGITSGAEDPSVALHINGVYQPRPRALDLASIDLERIEVLAGPQGTIYGRNATGGVVNYILKKPSEEFEGNIAALAANYDRYQISGAISGPITENLQFRIAGLYNDQNKGFVKNLQPNAPQSSLETNHTEGGRLALAYQPSSTVSITGEILLQKFRSSTDFSSLEPSADPVASALFMPTTSVPHRIFNDSRNSVKGRVVAPTLTAEWDASDNVSLKSITGYQHYRRESFLDADASGAALLQSHVTSRSSTWTQEFNANISGFDDRLKSIFGLYFFDDSLFNFDDNLFGFIVPGVQIPAQFGTKQKARSYAAFMDHTFSVTDRLRLQAGARYNIDKKKVDQTVVIGGGDLCGPSGLGIDEKWTAFTPKAGVQYDLNPRVMGYVQWQRGFTSGGVAANACNNRYNPEKVDAVEVGVKGTAFDRRLSFSTAFYHYKVSDLQVQQFDNLALLVNNAGASRILGFEVSASAILADWLRADIGANVQEAEYTKFSNCNPILFLGACGPTDPRSLSVQFQDLNGRALNRAPPYTLNLGLQADHKIADFGELTLRGEYFRSGKVNFDEFGSSGATQRAFSTVNIFLNYNSPSDRYHVRLFGRNLTDTKYKSSAFGLAGVSQIFVGTWGAPRTYGIEVAANF